MAPLNIRFEWNPAKAESNFRKHGITFEEATRVFLDENRIEEEDYTTNSELRWQTLGISKAFVLLLVINTVKEGPTEVIRIISARLAAPHERRKYYGNRQLHNR